MLVVVAVLATAAAALTGLSPSASAQTAAARSVPTQAVQCVTATNSEHQQADRASRSFFVYRAVGSGNSLGLSGSARTTLLSDSNGTSWSRVDQCPPVDPGDPGDPGDPVDPGDPGDRPPLEQQYTALYETDSRLRGHTIYRPTDLNAVDELMPIVVWGNGACRADGTWFQNFLQPLAAHGVLVVASGEPGGSGSTDAGMLVDAIDWAVAENTRAGSKYNGKLDTDAVAVMGQSCGGLEAIEASADRRVKSTVAWNSGIFGSGSKPDLGNLHAPIAWFTGGPSDIAYGNAVDDYSKVPRTVPAVLGHYGDVGHQALFSDARYRPTTVATAADWLDATLFDDAQAQAQFVGTRCGLCSGTPWQMSSKNW